jgi:CRP-like cAMP-binding protein
MKEIGGATFTHCTLAGAECSHVAMGAHPGCLFPQKGRLRKFPVREVVFHQDTGCRGLYRLREGLMALRRYHPDGQRSVVRVVRPGEIVGWADAFITGLHRWEGWMLTAGSLWYMPAVEWSALHPGDAQVHILSLAYAESRRLESALLGLSRLRAEDRVLFFLFSLAENPVDFPAVVDISVRRGDIAEVAAITAESCSRVLQRLEKRGWVTWLNPRTMVLDEAAAARVAEVVDWY